MRSLPSRVSPGQPLHVLPNPRLTSKSPFLFLVTTTTYQRRITAISNSITYVYSPDSLLVKILKLNVTLSFSLAITDTNLRPIYTLVPFPTSSSSTSGAVLPTTLPLLSLLSRRFNEISPSTLVRSYHASTTIIFPLSKR